MTKEEFRKLTENILILDGATGSNLMASGMPRGICTETWVIDHKDVIQDLQRAYIQAGSQVIYAPTFGGNRMNLAKHGLTDRIEEINRTLVGYSRELAGNGVYVAGDITTSGSFITADGDYTYTEAFDMYQEQVRILADAGIDLIAAETMINIEETLAAVDDHVPHDCRGGWKYLQRRQCYRSCCFSRGSRCRRSRYQLLRRTRPACIRRTKHQRKCIHPSHRRTKRRHADHR